LRADAPPRPEGMRMMTHQQLLEKYRKERLAKVATRDQLATEIDALDAVIGGLATLCGERPARPPRGGGATKATGTKALILDVLADGQRRSAKAIAAAIHAKTAATLKHLAALVAAGDVDRQGQSRATTYGIA